MTLSRRQALQLAAFGLLQGPALAQGQATPHRSFGGFENDPTGEKHDTTRWAMLPILGVLCTVTWKQSLTDKWTWFRGLKQGYAVGKNVLLKDEWQDLWVVGGRRLFGRLFGKEVDKTLWEIPLVRKGKDLKLGKPIATNYTTISMGSTCCGIQKEGSIDWFDSDGEVIVTLYNALTPPRPYGSVYSVELRDPSGIPVLAMMDGKGQLISPLLPEVKQFIYTKTRSDGGWSEYPILTVPVDKAKNLFLPINDQGQLPTDALKVRGYYPSIAFPPLGTADSPFIGARTVLVGGWLKEYDLEGSAAYGWVSEDLKRETGPVWRSMHNLPAPYPECMVGELLDGTWMVYRLAQWKQRDAGLPRHEPMLPEPAPSRDEALRRLPPLYQEKIVKPREEARQREQERLRLYWEQRSKDNIALLIAHGYTPGKGTETPAELQRIAETLRRIRTAIDLRLYQDYQRYINELPVDWQIRYILSGGQSAFGERYAITAEVVEGYAKSVRNPQFAAELRERATSLRAVEEARKKQDEVDAAAFKKRQEEWKKQGNPNGPSRPSGHVYTAPSSASWVYKPQPASTSPGLGQYMKDLYEYGRGRDWKPIYR